LSYDAADKQTDKQTDSKIVTSSTDIVGVGSESYCCNNAIVDVGLWLVVVQ